jgi:flagellar operon protein
MSLPTVEFGAALERLQRGGASHPTSKSGASREVDPGAFERALDHVTRNLESDRFGSARHAEPAVAEPRITLSRHATARLESRGIPLTADDLADVSDAVDQLQQKGARESLLLMGDHALIVGVPKRTVITAMTRQEAVGSIFTNIDSTMVVR